jgi:hypothetical protein
MLKVTIYPDADALANDEPVEHKAKYVSYVAPTTYGAPALVAPNPRDPQGREPRARVGDDVLYINTGFVAAWKITRESE